MELIKTINYTNSISEIYLDIKQGDIIELRLLSDGRVKKYILSKDDKRLNGLKQLKFFQSRHEIY